MYSLSACVIRSVRVIKPLILYYLKNDPNARSSVFITSKVQGPNE